MIKILITAATVAVSTMVLPARADDHMIRPTCWEENKGDHVERHCSVNGKDPAVRAPQPAAQAPRPSSSPPPVVADALPPGPPPIPVNPCAPYACGYGHPSPRGYFPPPYYGPPAIVFGFGPFSVVIP